MPAAVFLAAISLTTPALRAQEPPANPADTAANPSDTAANPADTAAGPVDIAATPVPTTKSIDANKSIDAAKSIDRENLRLRFSFNGARWRDVLDWLAEQSGLALHFNELPTGTFTYSDTSPFSLGDAINRLNLFMVPEGFAAVRRDELLTVIRLGDPRSLQQLDALARQATPATLGSFGDHEVVKCFVSLADTDADEAIAELQPLRLMTTPVVLPRSRQLIVTDTASKVRQVIAVLGAIEVPAEQRREVKRYDLQHTDSEAVLQVAAPHLGIPMDETSGLDITITTDLNGKRLFAIGNPEKIALLSQLVAVLDVAETGKVSTDESVLVSHPVQTDEPEEVLQVLQTLLEGESIRLSIQDSTGNLIAYAPAKTQQRIADIVDELAQPAIDFAVVELGDLDPYFAVALIDEMFSETPPPSTRSRVPAEIQRRPKIDADATSGRLFVRGTADEIKQIETLIEKLRQGQVDESRSRLVPIGGPQSDTILQSVRRDWSERNPILVRPGGIDGGPASDPFIERVLHEAIPQDESKSAYPSRPSLPAATLDTDSRGDMSSHGDISQVIDGRETWPISAPAKNANALAKSDVPPIRSRVTTEGIVLESDDPAALDRFEEQLRELAARANRDVSPPVVYYLKYVTAEVAVNMLADLLDGGYSVSADDGGLVLGSASAGLSSSTMGSLNGGGFRGSFLFKRDGTTTVTSGTATIVPDARLNRLIVQGTKAELAVIDRYMKIIDRAASLTGVETDGKTHIIELQHTRAEDVATMLTKAFPNRIAKSDSQRNGGASDRRASDGGRSDGDRREGDNRSRAPVQDKPTRGRESIMAIAIHEASNSLVITAPDPLYRQVRQLVDDVDRKSEKIMSVVTPGPGVDIEQLLEALGQETGGSRGSRGRSSSRRRDSGSRR